MQRYVTKMDTRVDGPWELGTAPFKCPLDYQSAVSASKKGDYDKINPELLVKHMGNLQKITSALSKGIDVTNTRGIWVVGRSGFGKSHWVRNEFTTGGLYIKS